MDLTLAMVGVGAAAGFGSWAIVLMSAKRNGHTPAPVTVAQAPATVEVDVTWMAEKFTRDLEAAFASWNNALQAQAQKRQLEVERLSVSIEALNFGQAELARLIKSLDEVPRRISGSFDWLIQTMNSVTDEYTKAPPPVWTCEITERLDQVVQEMRELVSTIPPPGKPPQLEVPPELAMLPDRMGEKLSDIVRHLTAERGKAKSPPPPPRPPAPDPGSGGGSPGNGPRQAPPGLPRLVPGTPPATPSIPASYVAGTVLVPGGTVWSLLYLIQQQLSLNCPGTSVEFAVGPDAANGGSVFVGGSSAIGGPLSDTNFAYELQADSPARVYRSTYPGTNTPVGELQVYAAADASLHVEVQS